MHRKIFACASMFLVISAFIGIPLTQSAVAVTIADSKLSPCALYITQSKAELTFSDSTATIFAFVKSTPGRSTKATIKATLQKYSNGMWTNVQNWSNSSSSYSVILSKTKTVSFGTYRVKAVIKVYQNGSWESKTIYSTSQKAS